MPSSGMLLRVAIVRREVSVERIASIIRVKRIGEPGATSAVTSKRRRFLSPCWRCYDPPKRRILQEPQAATSQKTAFFVVAAVNTSNLTLQGYSEHDDEILRPIKGGKYRRVAQKL
jgi:hypothetical protein